MLLLIGCLLVYFYLPVGHCFINTASYGYIGFFPMTIFLTFLFSFFRHPQAQRAAVYEAINEAYEESVLATTEDTGGGSSSIQGSEHGDTSLSENGGSPVRVFRDGGSDTDTIVSSPRSFKRTAPPHHSNSFGSFASSSPYAVYGTPKSSGRKF